jgi:hypothetical protein
MHNIIDTVERTKNKRKRVSLTSMTCQVESPACLRLKEGADREFLSLEYVLLNGMKIVFQVPAHKIETLIKESCHSATLIR